MAAASLLRTRLLIRDGLHYLNMRFFLPSAAGLNECKSTEGVYSNTVYLRRGIKNWIRGNKKNSGILEGIPKHFSQKERNILLAHNKAVKANEDTYIDPETGYSVLTKKTLLNNNECCGNACRHCPYGHENVPNDLKTKTYNSLFYV